MAFFSDLHTIGVTPIANIDSGVLSPSSVSSGSTTTYPTGPLVPGMIVRAKDPTYGEGEFILLAGVASTAVGDAVVYNTSSFTTSRTPVGSNVPQPMAIAMSANTAATTWGWYQIGGLAVANKTGSASLVVGAAVGFVTAGILNASSTGAEVQGAVVGATSTAAATTVQVMINRPHQQGRIT